jgi:type I restriction enzyme S subunit
MSIEGWDIGLLGEVCSITIGGTPSRANPAYWDIDKSTENLWVSIRDLNQRIITDTAEYLTKEGVKNSNVKKLLEGTVLLSFKLTIGRVAIAGKDLYTNEAIAGLCNSNIFPNFLYYGLQQWDLLQGVDQAIKGATLNKQKLNKIQFNYPKSIKEQEKIAEVLSAIDRAIAQTEAIIAKQQRIKTGLMQDLLTKGIDENGNIRNEATHEFKDSAIGRIPVEWEVSQLSKIAVDITSGSRWWAKYYSSYGAVFIRIGNLTREHINFRFDDVQYVQPPDSSEKNRTAVQEGDLLISVTADLGIIGVVFKDFGEAYINQHIALIRLDKQSVKSRFIGHYLASKKGQKQFEYFNESGAKAGLNLPTVGQIFTTLPKLNEQKRICDYLDLTDKIILKNKLNLAKLNRIKTGLMQDLLTGKVRVTNLLSQKAAAN